MVGADPRPLVEQVKACPVSVDAASLVYLADGSHGTVVYMAHETTHARVALKASTRFLAKIEWG